MLSIKEVIIVEGKYDKIKLSSIIDGLIIETDGFSIFNNKDQLALIRKLAKTKGILILTDSDGAGFKIRNFLRGAVPTESVKHAYIPDILGKEKRKTQLSKEGKLGVEGISKEIIIEALTKSGVFCEEKDNISPKITKTDLYSDGLSGCTDSFEKRRQLLKLLDLPERLTANSLLQVLNAMITYEEYRGYIAKLQKNAPHQPPI
jgi:ribonuclease M5